MGPVYALSFADKINESVVYNQLYLNKPDDL